MNKSKNKKQMKKTKKGAKKEGRGGGGPKRTQRTERKTTRTKGRHNLHDARTFGSLQGDNVAVLALARVVVGLDPGVVDTIEVKAVHSADCLSSHIHHLQQDP